MKQALLRWLPPVLLWASVLLSPARPVTEEYTVFVGTYTRGESRGIHAFSFDAGSGRAGIPRLVAETVNPSFLALSPDGRHLHAVNEIAGIEGEGTVSTYRIGPGGSLDFLDRMSTGGATPCHLQVDATGRNLLVANYGGGSVAVLRLEADGSLRRRSDLVRHLGSGLDPRRQSAPHAHCIRPDPSGRFAAATDLGIDKLILYPLDAAAGRLEANRARSFSFRPGAGPRHVAFHPDAPLALVNSELHSTLTSLRLDPGEGTIERLHEVSTLPRDFSGRNSTAETLVHPGGRFVYVSNRGHDSIAIFRLDTDTGELHPRGHRSTEGETPRNFRISPDGRWLLAANQGSDTVVPFRVDPRTGALHRKGKPIPVPSPVCIVLHHPQR